MKKTVVFAAALGLTLAASAKNMVVNPAPAPGNIDGYTHSIHVPSSPYPWRSIDVTVDAEGAVTFDNTKAPDGVEMAVGKVALKTLEPGKTYTLSLELRAENGGGFVLQLPAADPSGKTDKKGNPNPQGEWTQCNRKWKTVTATFIYEPGVASDSIILFFPKNSTGKSFSVRNVTVE